MPLTQVSPGDRILSTDINQYYNILKGVAASGEAITLIYNGTALIFQPSSDPSAGTRVLDIKNAAGTHLASLDFNGVLELLAAAAAPGGAVAGALYWDTVLAALEVYDGSGWRGIAGPWTSVTYAGGNFTGAGSLTWTVEVGDQTAYNYVLTGKTMTVSWYLATTSTGGTANPVLQIAIPASKTAPKRVSGTYLWVETQSGTNGIGLCDVGVTSGVIRLLKDIAATNWNNGSTNNLTVAGSLTFEVS